MFSEGLLELHKAGDACCCPLGFWDRVTAFLWLHTSAALLQICDYLSSHPTDAREWRVLYHYLLHELEQHPAVKAEAAQAAAGAHGGAGSSMLDVMQQRGSGRQVCCLPS